MLRAVARGAPGTLWRRIYRPPDPAAGADLTFPVPAHRAWQLLAVTCKFTASAVAGTREPALILADSDGTPLVESLISFNITAGLAPVCSWFVGAGGENGDQAAAITASLPIPWYMMPAESIKIIGHTDVGDTITATRITVLEVNTGDVAYERGLARGIADHLDAIVELYRTE